MAIVEEEVKSVRTELARVWEIYERERDTIETPENSGKLLVMDADSGDYEITDEQTGDAATRRLQLRHPSSPLIIGLRIGSQVAVSFSAGREWLEKQAAAAERDRPGREARAEQAWQIYYAHRAEIETPENIGKLIVIDTGSGDYEIAEDNFGIEASRRLHARHSKSNGLMLRIGYKTAISFSSGLERLEE